MASPWASGAWASGALAPGSWEIPPSGAGVVWQPNSWASSTWVDGSWQSAWAESGSYTITGVNTSLLVGKNLTSEYGSVTLNGQNVTLIKNYNLTADQGSLILSGQDVSLSSTLFRITLINSYNEVIDGSTAVQITGENLTGVTDVVLQYAASGALEENSWASGAWANSAWADGAGSTVDVPLTNVSVVNNSLVTADMFDVVTSSVPFTDVNYTKHRIAVTKGASTTYKYIELLPNSFYIVGTVQPANAITTTGQSIFSGITISPNMQVRLPTQIAGINVTWETVSGNVTGRLTLASPIPSATPIVIPIFEDGVGWDVINVTIRDISDVNTNLVASVGTFSIAGQDAGKLISRNLVASTGSFTITGEEVDLTKGYFVDPSSLTLSLTPYDVFITDTGIAIESLIGIATDTIQAGSEFSINGVGFGNDNSLDIILVDILNASVECVITQINNSFIRALAPSQSAALTEPVTLYVGDYQRDINNNIVLVDGVPVSEGRNVSRSVQVVSFNSENLYLSQIFETPTLTQNHFLDVDDLISNSLIDSTTVGGGQSSLTVDDVISQLSLSETTLIEHNVLSVDSLSISSSLDATSLVQRYLLPVNNLTLGSLLSITSLVQQHQLVSNNLVCQNLLAGSNLVQRNVLDTDDLSLELSLGDSAIIYKVFLNVDNLRSVLTENNVVNVPLYSLTVNTLSINSSLSTSLAIPTHSLTVNGITLDTAFDTTSLVEYTRTTNNSSRCSTSLTNVSLSQKFQPLTVNNLTIGSSLLQSRAKIITDPLTAQSIKSYPVLSGEILINQ